MTIEGEEVRDEQNAGVRLHEALTQLYRVCKRDRDKPQREVLCKAFRVAPDDVLSLQVHLAELHRLLSHVQSELAKQKDTKPRSLKWCGPVQAAVNQLSGGTQDTMASFCSTPRLSEALAMLDVCADSDILVADAWRDAELRKVHKALQDAMLTTNNAQLNARDDEEVAFYSWLTSCLTDVLSVVTDAEAFGIQAAREKLYMAVGKWRLHPCPQPRTEEGKKIFHEVGTVISTVGKIVSGATKLADVAKLLP